MAAVGTGSGKLILFGEHAAVFGHPAIGVSLPEKTTVTIHSPATKGWNFTGIPLADRPTLEKLAGRLNDLAPGLASHGAGAISIESSVPRGVGLGSSAALCSALAGAALSLVDGEEPSNELMRTWQLAHELERMFHGTPSGVDTGLSLLAGATAFSPKPPGLPLWEHLACAPLWLVVGAVPRAAGSGSLIRGIGERMASDEKDVRDSIQALGTIADRAKHELSTGAGADSIGALAEEAMDVLRALELSNPWLDSLLSEGKRSGAVGGKLSGAGGGGAFFLVCVSEKSAQENAVALSRAADERGITLVAGPRTLRIGS